MQKYPEIKPEIKPRPVCSHKGSFGNVLLVAGSEGMAGAAVLAAKACLRSGAGTVTVHSSGCNRVIIQTAVPEAMFYADLESTHISGIQINKKFDAAAFGPGTGTKPKTVDALKHFLAAINLPCVLDADALNIISENKSFLEKIPQKSILTPHAKEFERLFGKFISREEQVAIALENAVKYRLNIVLKGHKTLIVSAEGKVSENTTGNSGMATGGSGDVLTGFIAGLLAQHYSPVKAVETGVFLHGLAADLALETQSEESLTASDIIENFGKAYKYLKNKQQPIQ